MIRLLAAVVLLAGCASSAPERRARLPESTFPSNEELQSRPLHSELKRLDAELSNVDLQAAAPDCARITQLRDNICDLATRICRILERRPADSKPEAGWPCIDGQIRCKNAVERSNARGCPPPKK